MMDINNVLIFFLIFALIIAAVFYYFIVKDNTRNNIGGFFIFLSLITGTVFYLFVTLFLRGGKVVVLPLVPIGVHVFLTLITYWLSFREDIKNIKENRFLRTMIAVGLFIIVPIILVISLVTDPHNKSAYVLPFFIFSLLTPSFIAIMLSFLVSIIICRRSLHIKVWGVYILLVLIALLFLFSFSVFGIMLFIGSRLG